MSKEHCKLCQHTFCGLDLPCHYREDECPILRGLLNRKYEDKEKEVLL